MTLCPGDFGYPCVLEQGHNSPHQALPPTPSPAPSTACGRCGSSPVTHAEYRTGGYFTPPPFGVWMFLCSSCASGPHRSR